MSPNPRKKKRRPSQKTTASDQKPTGVALHKCNYFDLNLVGCTLCGWQQPDITLFHTELMPPLNQHRQAEDPEEVSASLRQPLPSNPISVDRPASVIPTAASTIHRAKKMASCFIGCAHTQTRNPILCPGFAWGQRVSCGRPSCL